MYISQIELSSTIIARLSTTVKWILADVRQRERNAINVKLDTGHSTRYPLELSNLRRGSQQTYRIDLVSVLVCEMMQWNAK
jgi:hypothetical protein